MLTGNGFRKLEFLPERLVIVITIVISKLPTNISLSYQTNTDRQVVFYYDYS